MNDALLVRVLNGAANVNEELQPSLCADAIGLAVICDGNTFHQLHHEKGPPVFGGAAIEHLCDVWMVHQREGLPLGFEAGHDLLRVHAELDDLQSNAAL